MGLEDDAGVRYSPPIARVEQVDQTGGVARVPAQALLVTVRAYPPAGLREVVDL
jgi:hypothetical protein